jgi:hypothetical protein
MIISKQNFNNKNRSADIQEKDCMNRYRHNNIFLYPYDDLYNRLLLNISYQTLDKFYKNSEVYYLQNINNKNILNNLYLETFL